MSKREAPAGQSEESPIKLVKVKSENGEEKINVESTSVEVAVAVLSNISLHIQDCTLSDDEKACAIKCAKLALLEKDGQQARSEFIRQEMAKILGGGWTCIVGGFGGMSLEGPHLKFKYGEDSIVVMKNPKSDPPVDLLKVIDCAMEDSMKEDAIRTVKTAFVLYKDKTEIAKHIAEEFDARHRSCWTCAINGTDGGLFTTRRPECYISLSFGNLLISLLRSANSYEPYDY